MAQQCKILSAKQAFYNGKASIVFNILSENEGERVKWVSQKHFQNLSGGASPSAFVGGTYSDDATFTKAGTEYTTVEGEVKKRLTDGYYANPLSIDLSMNPVVSAELSAISQRDYAEQMLLASIAKMNATMATSSSKTVNAKSPIEAK